MVTGLGEYHLRAAYQIAKIDIEDLDLISTRSPETIVQHLKKDISLDDGSTDVTVENLDDESEKLMYSKQPVTMFSRAQALVEDNKINFNPKMHIFNVQGTHDVRVISLYPKENCSCPANGMCYHILGVKLSLGTKESGRPMAKDRNLTQLRKNTRLKKDKKSGRK